MLDHQIFAKLFVGRCMLRIGRRGLIEASLLATLVWNPNLDSAAPPPPPTKRMGRSCCSWLVSLLMPCSLRQFGEIAGMRWLTLGLMIHSASLGLHTSPPLRLSHTKNLKKKHKDV